MHKPITGEMLDICIDDSIGRLRGYDKGGPIEQEFLSVYCWPQQWASTACGFPGVGGAAMTTAPTIVIAGPDGDVCVYHNGRFAAYLRRPSEEFWRRMGNLPGAGEARWWADQEMTRP